MADRGAHRLSAAVIGDVVVSRAHADQAALIDGVADALAWTNERVAATQALAITIGDEFQGAYPTLGAALDAALFVRLRLEGRYDVRFGIGWGEITSFDPERAPMGQSGAAWWSAREAIESVAATARKRQWPRSVRTFVGGVEEPLHGTVNAFLICRDAILGRMDAKDLRITRGLFVGERQKDIAAELGITQPSIARRQVENGASAVYQAHQAATALSG